MKLLLVEDSRRLQRSLKTGLEKEGFALDLASDGNEGYDLAESVEYDVIILDLMLPGMDGLTLLQKLRRKGRKTHVLILSARDQVQDRIRGLEMGADDYLIKPFDYTELLARIRALIRRRYETKDPCLHIGSIEVNTALQEVQIKDRKLDLSPKEYALLEYLVMRRGRVISRNALIEHLYNGYGDVASNVIDVVVCNLRRKIQPKDEPTVINTKRGLGYYIS